MPRTAVCLSVCCGCSCSERCGAVMQAPYTLLPFSASRRCRVSRKSWVTRIEVIWMKYLRELIFKSFWWFCNDCIFIHRQNWRCFSGCLCHWRVSWGNGEAEPQTSNAFGLCMPHASPFDSRVPPSLAFHISSEYYMQNLWGPRKLCTLFCKLSDQK